jgi:hypothetical protein
VSRRRGRPRTNRLDLFERCADVLKAEPNADTRRVQSVVRANRADVVRAVRILKKFGQASHPPEIPDPVLIIAEHVEGAS